MMQRLPAVFSDQGRRHAAPFPDPELTNEIRRVLLEEQPEIVHAHNWIIHSFLPLKQWSNAGLVLSVGDYSLICAKKKLIFKDEWCEGPGFVKCLTCGADHYGLAKGVPTVFGNWMMGLTERHLVDRFLPVSRAVAAHNGIVSSKAPFEVISPFVPDDVDDPAEAPDEFLAQLPEGDFLLYVGAFGRYKGVDVLLEAHRQLENPPPLVIMGYQTSEHPVRTTDLPDNVIVIKDVPHSAVMEAWRRSLIGLVPSVWAEPFGIVALEAMACGKPVIASAVGGLTDIVDHEVTGLLVPPADVEALRQAMQRLLDDEELRDYMGNCGRQRVDDFSASAVVPRYERVYREVIGQKHGK
jgi:glycosyltransferase involved in cell wall biosynthesis